MYEQTRDAAHHACRCHGAAKAHGADDEPDGRHHAAHASCGHQVGEHSAVGVDGGAAIEAYHRCLKQRRVDVAEHTFLKHQSCNHRHESREEEGYNGRRATCNEHTREHRHEQQPRRDVEASVEGACERLYVLASAGVVEQTGDGEENERDDHRRHGCDEHVTNVLEQRHAKAARGKSGGLAQRRDLVAKVGSADNGSCHPSVAKALRPSNAHESYAYGRNGCPRRAGHDAHQGTDGTGGGKEDVGVYGLHAIIDQRGHHAAHHPCAAESANEQQYDQCARHARHILRYGFLEARPWHVEVAHANEHTQRRHREERYL